MQQHYHLTISSTERLLAIDEQYPTKWQALAEARKYAVEAKGTQGQISYVGGEGESGVPYDGYLVSASDGEPYLGICVSPCSGQHASEEVPALVA